MGDGALAVFARGSADRSCPPVAKDGTCTLHSCGTSGSGSTAVLDPPTETPTYLDAGPVSVTGKERVSLVRSLDGSYKSSSSSQIPFAPGDPISFKVGGHAGDPPAFDLAVCAPGDAAVILGDASTHLDHTQAAHFQWTPTFGDLVNVSLSFPEMVVLCSWPMADGEGFVPPSMLSEGIATIEVDVSSTSQKETGRWRMSASALVVLTGNGYTFD